MSDLETRVASLEAQLAELRSVLERTSPYQGAMTAIARERAAEARIRAHAELMAAGADERASRLMMMSDAELRMVAEMMGPGERVDVARSLSGEARARFMVALSLDERGRVVFELSPAPKYVRARIARPDCSRLATPKTVIDRSTALVESERDWNARVDADDHLAELVERGSVVTEPLTDSEARARAFATWVAPLPHLRARLPELP